MNTRIDHTEKREKKDSYLNIDRVRRQTHTQLLHSKLNYQEAYFPHNYLKHLLSLNSINYKLIEKNKKLLLTIQCDCGVFVNEIPLQTLKKNLNKPRRQKD